MHPTQAWQDLLHPGNAIDYFIRRKFLPFDLNAVGYSGTNALWLAELSRLVYRHGIEENSPPPQPTRSSFLTANNLKQVAFFLSTATDTQAMLVKSATTPPFAVLAFRGTEQTLQDFISNLEIGVLPLNPHKVDVHDGFSKALDSVWSDIDKELAQLNCPVFYTGHSLGAALATLAAERRTPQAVYTFGSPLVGNQAFVNSLGQLPIYRIVDDEDLVTTLPPAILGFRHVGTEIRLIAPTNIPLLHHLFNPPKPLADHSPVNYVDRI